MTNYIYDQAGEYAGVETDGVIIPSVTSAGIILKGWVEHGCPGIIGTIDGDAIYDTPGTIYPADPLFGLALLEYMESKDWLVTAVTPLFDLSSPTANAIATATGGNCGIGPGGFQHGNTCAKGGGGIHIPGLGEMKKIGDLPGGTHPILVEDQHGKKWVMKSGKGKRPQLENEAMADAAYRALGVPVPKSHTVEMANGELVKMSEYIEGGQEYGKWKEGKTQHQIDMMNKEIGKHLAVDAVLANWDVAGTGQNNILIKDGVPYRIDNGGALLYRALGEAKGTAFGTNVTEHDTLRSMSKNKDAAGIFEKVTDGELFNQANQLYMKKHELLEAITDPKVKAVVNERVNNLMDKMTDGSTKPVPPPPPPPAPKPTPTPTAVPQPPGGKAGADKLHTAEGVTEHIHANKGNVPFSDLYTEKLQVMNPNGVKDGVFFIPSFPTGEKSSLEKVAQLEKILPAGTIIKKKSITAKQVEEWKVKQKGMTPEQAKATTKPITPGKPKATAPITPPVPVPTPKFELPPDPMKSPALTGTGATHFLNKTFAPGTGEHILQTIAKNIKGDQSNVLQEVKNLTSEQKGKLKAHLGLNPGESGTANKLIAKLQDHGVLPKSTLPDLPSAPAGKPNTKKTASKKTAEWWTPPAGSSTSGTDYMPPVASNSSAKMLFSPLFSLEENQKWANSLTMAENIAVGEWKGSAKAIRAAVEGGTATPGTVAGNFMSAITKSKPHEGLVYRGIYDDGKTNYATATAKAIIAAGVGGVWSDPAPHCTSPNPNRGNAFSKGDVMFRIATKTGRPIQRGGKSFLSSGPSEEMEVVGMPGTKYKIKAIAENVATSDDHTKHVYEKVKYLIDLEEI